MTSCPACNRSVDPLRSRFVGVVGGKVVAYCSAECAARSAPSGAVAAATPSGAVTVPVAAPSPAPAASPAPVVASPAPADEATAKPPAIVTPASGIPLERPITPAPGVPIALESGPVIEIVREPGSEAAAAPRAKHPDEISLGAFWSEDHKKTGGAPALGTAPRPAASRPAVRETAIDPRIRDAAALDSMSNINAAMTERRSRLPLVLLVLVLLAGGGFLLYQFLVKSSVSAATLPTAPVPTPRPSAVVHAAVAPQPAVPEAPAVDPAAALAQARTALTAGLGATSRRLQRIAAAALARTGDPAACTVLAAQLGLGDGAAADARETSDIARLDLAYSLARAGDPRGGAALAAALYAPRGEARDEAARLLALLGDPRAAPHLVDVLAVPQRRLGAAEHLAHLAEPHALKVLAQLRGDARSTADDKARAAIALGIAGHADVAPALRDMLGDPHFNAFAAAALAELKDRAARDVLERQLDSPSLRVRSARALRRLEPDLDPRPVLPRLLAVLGSGRDTDQIQAAEAILLLAGPVAWSAYD